MAWLYFEYTDSGIISAYLAIEIGMGKRTNTILQSAFFSLAKVLPFFRYDFVAASVI